jgi:hypothetical protein
MGLFSSRAVAITGELRRLAADYEASHGTPPSRRTLWLLHQPAGQNTRRCKNAARRTLAGQTGSAEPTDAERFAAWEAQTARREIQALSQVHGQAAAYAAGHGGKTRVVLVTRSSARPYGSPSPKSSSITPSGPWPSCSSQSTAPCPSCPPPP